jgi:cytoskeleton protein RodZ
MVSNTDIPNIGDLLREKREDLKLTIDKVAIKTKINPNILKQIEKNDFEKLPSPAYTKGFVLSYALMVGIDKAQAIISLEMTYQRLLGKPFPALNHTVNLPNPNAMGERTKSLAETPVKKTPSTKSNQETTESTPQDIISGTDSRMNQTRLAISSGIFITLFLGIFGLYKLVTNAIDNETKVTHESKYGPTFVPSSDILKAPEATAKPEEKQKEEKETETTKTAEAAKPTEKDETKTETPPPATTIRRNFPPIEFKKITKKLFDTLMDAPENSDEKLLPEDVKNKTSADTENVYIRAVTGNTWLSYKIDKQPITSVIVEKDKDLFLQGKEIVLYLGNVGVTKIFYNNKLISTPTPSGVKSLVFPESANPKYSLPLFPKAADDILYSAEDYQKRMKLEDDQIKAQQKTE